MSVDSLVRQLRDDGFCIIESVVPANEVDRVRQSVADTVARLAREGIVPPGGLDFVAGIINHDQSFAPYLADERLIGVAKAVLGEFVRISFTSAILNKPGKARDDWHADWPFNQRLAGRIKAPYPDIIAHLTTLFMLSPFTRTNGGTLVVPGSHRTTNNPSGDNGVDPYQPYPTEFTVTAPAGSVVVMDSRLWHCGPANPSAETRVALAVRYAPWWLNLDVLRPGSDTRARMVDETGRNDNKVPCIPRAAFERLPDNVKQLYRHWRE